VNSAYMVDVFAIMQCSTSSHSPTHTDSGHIRSILYQQAHFESPLTFYKLYKLNTLSCNVRFFDIIGGHIPTGLLYLNFIFWL